MTNKISRYLVLYILILIMGSFPETVLGSGGSGPGTLPIKAEVGDIIYFGDLETDAANSGHAAIYAGQVEKIHQVAELMLI